MNKSTRSQLWESTAHDYSSGHESLRCENLLALSSPLSTASTAYFQNKVNKLLR